MSITKKIEFFFREEWSKEVEWDAVADEFRCASVDVFYTYKREVSVSSLWWLDLAGNSIASLKSVLLDLML